MTELTTAVEGPGITTENRASLPTTQILSTSLTVDQQPSSQSENFEITTQDYLRKTNDFMATTDDVAEGQALTTVQPPIQTTSSTAVDTGVTLSNNFEPTTTSKSLMPTSTPLAIISTSVALTSTAPANLPGHMTTSLRTTSDIRVTQNLTLTLDDLAHQTN